MVSLAVDPTSSHATLCVHANRSREISGPGLLLQDVFSGQRHEQDELSATLLDARTLAAQGGVDGQQPDVRPDTRPEAPAEPLTDARPEAPAEPVAAEAPAAVPGQEAVEQTPPQQQQQQPQLSTRSNLTEVRTDFASNLGSDQRWQHIFRTQIQGAAGRCPCLALLDLEALTLLLQYRPCSPLYVGLPRCAEVILAEGRARIGRGPRGTAHTMSLATTMPRRRRSSWAWSPDR